MDVSENCEFHAPGRKIELPMMTQDDELLICGNSHKSNNFFVTFIVEKSHFSSDLSLRLMHIIDFTMSRSSNLLFKSALCRKLINYPLNRLAGTCLLKYPDFFAPLH